MRKLILPLTLQDKQSLVLDPAKSDGMWYYHVWTDTWMSRPDLKMTPADLAVGWQALDATPQRWAFTLIFFYILIYFFVSGGP